MDSQALVLGRWLLHTLVKPLGYCFSDSTAPTNDRKARRGPVECYLQCISVTDCIYSRGKKSELQQPAATRLSQASLLQSISCELFFSRQLQSLPPTNRASNKSTWPRVVGSHTYLVLTRILLWISIRPFTIFFAYFSHFKPSNLFLNHDFIWSYLKNKLLREPNDDSSHFCGTAGLTCLSKCWCSWFNNKNRAEFQGETTAEWKEQLISRLPKNILIIPKTFGKRNIL